MRGLAILTLNRMVLKLVGRILEVLGMLEDDDRIGTLTALHHNAVNTFLGSDYSGGGR